MRPIDFVIHDGDSSPNMPAHEVAEAMMKKIVIRTEDGECEVLSYYYSDGVMNLDVKEKD